MSGYSIKNYSALDTAASTTDTQKEKVTSFQTELNSTKTNLNNDAVFMGPLKDECISAIDKSNAKLTASIENYANLSKFLLEAKDTYKTGDNKAKNAVEGKKSINTSSVISGSNVANATTKYKTEIDNAKYATVNKNLFSTTTTEYINGQPVEVTHIVINNGSQINGAPANGRYGNGVEKSSSAAQRLNSPLVINGSFFNDDGTEDLKGNNHVVIVDGKIVHDGTSGGQEIFLDKDGNIFNAYGKTAQELVDSGVKYSFSSHSTQVIENGDTSPSYREPRYYKRTVIGQSAPGEYYIVTDTNDRNKLSDTAEYLKSKGCNNAYSMDQGGSVSLVRDGSLINNPSDSTGERPVADFLYFTE